MNRTLNYFYDPMCSWCYGFKPNLKKLIENLPEDIEFVSVLGGLAKDTDETMSEEMQQRLQNTWKAVEKKIKGTRFNFDFWSNNRPRRSTYASCRAVLAAKQIDPAMETSMNEQIQKAYYQQALNPSEDSVLIKCAEKIGLERERFETVFYSEKTIELFNQQLSQCSEMGVSSYPSLILQLDQSRWPVAIDYSDWSIILEEIEAISSL